MSDSPFLKSVDKAVRDVQQNRASVEATTEQVEAAITHTAASWSLTAFARRFWKRKGVDAGIKVDKSW